MRHLTSVTSMPTVNDTPVPSIRYDLDELWIAPVIVLPIDEMSAFPILLVDEVMIYIKLSVNTCYRQRIIRYSHDLNVWGR